MSKTIAIAVAGLGILGTSLVNQSAEPLDHAALKTMINGLGFETTDLVKDAGKEKYQFTLKTQALNIPVGAEISPSKNYIWFTVSLGPHPTEPSKHLDLLKQNGKMQPCQFYVTTSGNLMMAVAIDNRGVTASHMKRVVEKLKDDVDASSSIWLKK